jgi:four helix bundle protein
MIQYFKTRQWTHPEGYKYLAVWKNAVELQKLTKEFTKTLPYSEKRRKDHMDDASRSVQRNIEEGYKRPTTKEYLDFLGFSQGSLEELKGDIRDCLRDGLMGKELHDKFIELINKTDWLLRRLVKSLEKKMSEEMPMSPRERWLKARAIKQLEEDRKFDEEARKSLNSP